MVRLSDQTALLLSESMLAGREAVNSLPSCKLITI